MTVSGDSPARSSHPAEVTRTDVSWRSRGSKTKNKARHREDLSSTPRSPPQPGTAPEAIAPLYWELHTERDQVEKIFQPA